MLQVARTPRRGPRTSCGALCPITPCPGSAALGPDTTAGVASSQQQLLRERLRELAPDHLAPEVGWVAGRGARGQVWGCLHPSRLRRADLLQARARAGGPARERRRCGSGWKVGASALLVAGVDLGDPALGLARSRGARHRHPHRPRAAMHVRRVQALYGGRRHHELSRDSRAGELGDAGGAGGEPVEEELHAVVVALDVARVPVVEPRCQGDPRRGRMQRVDGPLEGEPVAPRLSREAPVGRAQERLVLGTYLTRSWRPGEEGSLASRLVGGAVPTGASTSRRSSGTDPSLAGSS